MAQTYLVTGLVVQPLMRAGPAVGSLSPTLDAEYYADLGWEPPRNYPLLRFTARRTSLNVCFWNVGHGVLAIRAPSRPLAYELSDTLWGYLSLAFGFEPDLDSGLYVLQEVDRAPQPSWTDEQLLRTLGFSEATLRDGVLYGLTSGPALDHRHLLGVRDRLPPLLEIPKLHDALLHFRASRQLFHGYIVGSYYHSHYSRDRRQLHWRHMEKLSFEFRTRFELAFLASFKAIEALLGKGHFRASEVGKLITSAPHLGVTPQTTYQRYHEVFRGHRQKVSVEDLLPHFLKLRNAVAAHANSTPPRHLMLSEDNVYEIQNFVAFLVSSAISQVGPLSNVKRFDPFITEPGT